MRFGVVVGEEVYGAVSENKSAELDLAEIRAYEVTTELETTVDGRAYYGVSEGCRNGIYPVSSAGLHAEGLVSAAKEAFGPGVVIDDMSEDYIGAVPYISLSLSVNEVFSEQDFGKRFIVPSEEGGVASFGFAHSDEEVYSRYSEGFDPFNGEDFVAGDKVVLVARSEDYKQSPEPLGENDFVI